MPTPIFITMNDVAFQGNVTFDVKKDAKDSAENLARQTKETIYVLKVIGFAKAEDAPVTHTDLE